MFNEFLITVNQWMTGGLVIASMGAFAWGMVSVLFSPCHMASIPLIVAYVGEQESAVNPRRRDRAPGRLFYYRSVCQQGLNHHW